MNKVITDGASLMPIAFAQALDFYSSQDGTPGSETYADAPDAAQIVNDAEFGPCLEVTKNQGTQRLRYMGETPLLPGCYLRVTARVRVIDGALPTLRIAGFAGGRGGTPVAGVVTTGPVVAVPDRDTVVEVSAIVGAGARPGVDMVWGPDALYGHFGLDLTGPTGGVVRIDDLIIEDVTSFFLRDLLATVDVRDYGALGDGVTDDSVAFRAADAVARGRQLLVSRGTYLLNEDITLKADVRFEGALIMPSDVTLMLRRNFDLPTYMDAFGCREVAFRKGFQALLKSDDQHCFDLCGLSVVLTKPMMLRGLEPGQDHPVARRILRNGRLEARVAKAWSNSDVNLRAAVSGPDLTVLKTADSIADVPVGARVQGEGIGPEIYVRSVDATRRIITLSAPLKASVGTRNFTFKRFQYLLDFSGIWALNGLVLQDIELACHDMASGIMLAPDGQNFQLKDCVILHPKNRGVTSIGEGCAQLLIDRCQITAHQNQRVVGMNVNANGVRISNSGFAGVLSAGVLGGKGHVLAGNQFSQTGGGSSAWVFRGAGGAHFSDAP